MINFSIEQQLDDCWETEGGFEILYKEKVRSSLASLAKALDHLKLGESELIQKLSQKFASYNAPRVGKKRWSVKYKKKINCSSPKGFSQKQYCRRKSRGGEYR